MKGIEKIEGFIEKLDNNESRFLFLVIDSKGNPMANIAHVYQQVKTLIDLGYSASILTDSQQYGGVEWLGEEYSNIPIINIKEGDFEVSASDFVFIPELYTSVMEALKDYPCKKIVMVQNYEYALETIGIGSKWTDYNFFDAIVTNDNMGDFVKRHFPSIKTHNVPLSIPNYFKDKESVRKPIILVGARDFNEASRFVKSFYLQNPLYQWISFKIVSDISREGLSDELNESAALVWIDRTASFGTLPLEAMATNTPVLGLIPNMIPEWMVSNGETSEILNNGIWTNTTFELIDVLPNYLEMWLEDNQDTIISSDLMQKTVSPYSVEKQTETIKSVFDKLIDDRKNEFKLIIEKYGK